jgi:hypothetical protein
MPDVMSVTIASLADMNEQSEKLGRARCLRAACEIYSETNITWNRNFIARPAFAQQHLRCEHPGADPARQAEPAAVGTQQALRTQQALGTQQTENERSYS